MVRTPVYAFALLLMGAACPAAARADQLADIKARNKLVCGVLGGYEPFGFQDPMTREVNGYEPELCRGLAAALGVAPELKVVTAQGRVPELLQGRVDVEAALLGWTKEREAQVDYSNVYAMVASKIMVLTDSGLATGEQLTDRKIGVAKGSSLESIAQARFPKATVISFDDTPAAYLALRQGKIAGLLMTETTLASLRHQDPRGDRTTVLPAIYENAQQAFVMRKGGNDTLKASIDAYLDDLERSGKAQALYDRWFGADSKLKLVRKVPVGTPLVRD